MPTCFHDSYLAPNALFSAGKMLLSVLPAFPEFLKFVASGIGPFDGLDNL